MKRTLAAEGRPAARPVADAAMLAESVVNHCAQYLRQREHWSPRMNAALRVHALRWRTVIGLVLSLTQVPRLGRHETLNVFHTAKHAVYMKAFEARTVLLTGGVDEWTLARREGYRFVWAFGAIAAVELALFRRWTRPLVGVLALWRRALARPRRVTVFLYEDTLSHGTFLAHAARDLANGARTVCIAHGYYGELDVPLRYEGALCDHNFVWDERQVALLAPTHAGLVVIGAPHDARARPTALETVVLVGVGHPSAEPVVFERSMHCYDEIARIAARRPGLRVVYRPHPAERADPQLMDALRARFGPLDELPLADRLNGALAVFVGFVSSVLHEAAVAGHRVVHVAGHPGARPLFHRDLELSPHDMAPFDAWLDDARGLPPPPPRDDASPQSDALARFRRALAQMG